MIKPKIIQVIEDIVYGTMGVQNSEEHKKQFEHASALTYIFAGLLSIAVFVAFLAFMVSIIV